MILFKIIYHFKLFLQGKAAAATSEKKGAAGKAPGTGRGRKKAAKDESDDDEDDMNDESEETKPKGKGAKKGAPAGKKGKKDEDEGMAINGNIFKLIERIENNLSDI